MANEYELPIKSDTAQLIFDLLDPFTQGFMQALFWTNASPDSEPEMRDAVFDDLDPHSARALIDECKSFQERHQQLLNYYYHFRNESDAGHDFLLTRNGVGSGFWARHLPNDLGERLTVAAKDYCEISLRRGDDGKVHIE